MDPVQMPAPLVSVLSNTLSASVQVLQISTNHGQQGALLSLALTVPGDMGEISPIMGSVTRGLH